MTNDDSPIQESTLSSSDITIITTESTIKPSNSGSPIQTIGVDSYDHDNPNYYHIQQQLSASSKVTKILNNNEHKEQLLSSPSSLSSMTIMTRSMTKKKDAATATATTATTMIKQKFHKKGKFFNTLYLSN